MGTYGDVDTHVNYIDGYKNMSESMMVTRLYPCNKKRSSQLFWGSTRSDIVEHGRIVIRITWVKIQVIYPPANLYQGAMCY